MKNCRFFDVKRRFQIALIIDKDTCSRKNTYRVLFYSRAMYTGPMNVPKKTLLEAFNNLMKKKATVLTTLNFHSVPHQSHDHEISLMAHNEKPEIEKTGPYLLVENSRQTLKPSSQYDAGVYLVYLVASGNAQLDTGSIIECFWCYWCYMYVSSNVILWTLAPWQNNGPGVRMI